jgi:hypothetical protein
MRKQRERTTRAAVEVIYCPECNDQPMLLVAVKPLLLASGVEEMHYRCRVCSAQDLRIAAPPRH